MPHPHDLSLGLLSKGVQLQLNEQNPTYLKKKMPSSLPTTWEIALLLYYFENSASVCIISPEDDKNGSHHTVHAKHWYWTDNLYASPPSNWQAAGMTPSFRAQLSKVLDYLHSCSLWYLSLGCTFCRCHKRKKPMHAQGKRCFLLLFLLLHGYDICVLAFYSWVGSVLRDSSCSHGGDLPWGQLGSTSPRRKHPPVDSSPAPLGLRL